MSKHTLKERLEAGLKAQGWQPCANASRFSAFMHPYRPGVKRFVGPSGALRQGRNASNSSSLEFSNRPFYDALLVVGDAALAEEKQGEFK